jgi:hypothetical protein
VPSKTPTSRIEKRIVIATGSFDSAAHTRRPLSDPVHYTQPWTGETQYLRSNEAIFEDACHEGKYSLKHILEGGRVRDGRAALVSTRPPAHLSDDPTPRDKHPYPATP